MDATNYQDIKSSLRQLYLEDPRPWLVGFSGGKDHTMLVSLNHPVCKLYSSPGAFCLFTSNGGKVVVGSRFQPCSTFGACHHSTLPVFAIQIDASAPSWGNSRFGRALSAHL